MKFATQISPLLNQSILFFFKLDNTEYGMTNKSQTFEAEKAVKVEHMLY